MEINISVKNPTPEFEQDLLALLDKHRASIRRDPGWNADRARIFYGALGDKAKHIMREVVARDGKVDADQLRASDGSSLRGHASAFAKVVRRGAGEGWWDSGMESPIIALGPGSGKVRGYQIRDSDTLASFRLALADDESEVPA
jgi:hypothetical protein